MTKTMAIIKADGQGGPESLHRAEAPIPAPASGELRIATRVAGINRPDMFQRDGLYPAPQGHSPILGLECAGVVDALGDCVTGWKRGDAVCALLNGGGYAEYVCVPQGQVMAKPQGWSWEEAAAWPETALTVWANLFHAGPLGEGARLLVHGAASGIGTTAIAMAKEAGHPVLATARSTDKHERLRARGADAVWHPYEDDWVSAIKEQGGADVVLDMIGGDTVGRNIKALNPGGALVFIAFLAGSRVEMDLMPVMLKRLQITGSTLRARPDGEKAALTAALMDRFAAAMQAGRLRPIVDRSFALDNAAQAHAYLDSGDHFGKVVLTVE